MTLRPTEDVKRTVICISILNESIDTVVHFLTSQSGQEPSRRVDRPVHGVWIQPHVTVRSEYASLPPRVFDTRF